MASAQNSKFLRKNRSWSAVNQPTQTLQRAVAATAGPSPRPSSDHSLTRSSSERDCVGRRRRRPSCELHPRSAERAAALLVSAAQSGDILLEVDVERRELLVELRRAQVREVVPKRRVPAAISKPRRDQKYTVISRRTSPRRPRAGRVAPSRV